MTCAQFPNTFGGMTADRQSGAWVRVAEERRIIRSRKYGRRSGSVNAHVDATGRKPVPCRSALPATPRQATSPAAAGTVRRCTVFVVTRQAVPSAQYRIRLRDAGGSRLPTVESSLQVAAISSLAARMNHRRYLVLAAADTHESWLPCTAHTSADGSRSPRYDRPSSRDRSMRLKFALVP